MPTTSGDQVEEFLKAIERAIREDPEVDRLAKALPYQRWNFDVQLNFLKGRLANSQVGRLHIIGR